MHHGQSKGSKKRKRTKIGGKLKHLAEIGEKSNVHHWLREVDAPTYIHQKWLLTLMVAKRLGIPE